MNQRSYNDEDIKQVLIEMGINVSDFVSRMRRLVEARNKTEYDSYQKREEEYRSKGYEMDVYGHWRPKQDY